MSRLLLVGCFLFGLAACDSGQKLGDCSTYTGGCAPNAECVMVGEIPTCQCKPGYSGDGVSCTNSDAPKLEVSSPLADALLSSSSLEVQGTASDLDLVEVTISVDGAASQKVEVSAGAFHLTVPLAEEDYTKHTVVVTAKDGAKHETTVTRSFGVDRVGPTLSITSPAADATCGTACTGAIVNLAAGATFEFSGAATDKGGVVPESLVATLDDQPVELTKGAAWSFTWAAIPKENGAFHTLKLVAQDKAGNASEVSRKVYVDRVAPCAKNLVPGARLVKRTAALVEFTEAMDSTSTALAMVTNPAVTALPVLDASGKKLGFAKDEDLVAYQVYGLDLRATATDRAGNPVGDAAGCKLEPGKWLTEPVLPAGLPGQAEHATTLLVDVDPDGLPYAVVAFADPDWDYGDSEAQVWAWDGRASFKKTPLDMWMEGEHQCTWFWPVDFRVLTTPGADLQLVRTGHVTGMYGKCGNATQGPPTWRLEYRRMPGVASVDEADSLAYQVADPFYPPTGISKARGGYDFWPPSAASVALLALDPNDDKRVLWKGASVQWSAATERYKSPSLIRGFRGGALVNDKPVYLPGPTVVPFPVTDPATEIVVFGLPQRSRQEPSSGFWNPVGAGWIAWSERVTSTGQDYGAMYLACSNTPHESSTWKRSVDLSPIAAGDRNSGIRVTDIRIAASDSLAAIAVATSDRKVFTATLPNECTLPTGLAWSPPTAGESTAIAVGPDGRVWRAGK